jgi:hypothetical protein
MNVIIDGLKEVKVDVDRLVTRMQNADEKKERLKGRIREFTSLALLPAAPGLCQECAMEHPVTAPHNQKSLHYQYHFRQRHDRWPTWDDAMAHCTDEVKSDWRRELIKHREMTESLL